MKTMISAFALVLNFVLILASPSASAQTLENHSNGPSENNRQAKTYSLLFQPIGLGEGVTQGASASYFLDPNFHVGVRWIHGEEFSAWFDDYKVSSNTVAFTMRHFLDNSFYIESGLATHHRSVDRKTRDWWNDTSVESHYKTRDNGFVFGLGNQWQWSHFTIGAEWVGVYVPMTAKSSTGHKRETQADGSVRSLGMDQYEKSPDVYVRGGNLQIGFTF